NMINAIGITKDHKIEQQAYFTEADLSKFPWIWIDLVNPERQEIENMIHLFDLHPATMDHTNQRLQRPKIEQYNNYTYCIAHTLNIKNNEIEKKELTILIGENFILTTHSSPIHPIQQTWEDLSSYLQQGSPFTYTVFYQLLHSLTESYFALVEQIEDELETIEDNTHDKKMNDMISQLIDVDFGMNDTYKKQYFTRICDRLLKLSEMVTTNREITVDIRDNYLSLNSYQTNRLITVLTIIAAIFTPLTFIAGVYGMNFKNMPELNWNSGYFLVLGLMGFLAISMFIWFKIKGWFK